jgi:hypothetical protein
MTEGHLETRNGHDHEIADDISYLNGDVCAQVPAVNAAFSLGNDPAGVALAPMPSCETPAAASINSSMRPHCLNRDACAAKGSGHCRRCWGAELRARVAASPEIEARRRHSCAVAIERVALRNAPDGRTRMAEIARQHNILQRPEVRAKALSPEARARSEAGRYATHMSKPAEERSAISRRGAETKAAKEAGRKLRLKQQVAAIVTPAILEARRQIAEFDRKQRERREREKRMAY